jgi:predicted RNA binding protein YcfA (HicA-like mRNA interferase family)
MDKSEKLFERLQSSPHNATFTDLKALLIAEGFHLDRIESSHHVFKKGTVIFVIPMHGKKVKSVYVKRALSIIAAAKKEK